MRARVLIGLVGTVGVLATAALVALHATGGSTGGPQVGTQAPGFAVRGQRELIDSTMFRGRTLVLVFAPPSCDCAGVLRTVDAVAPKMIGPAGSRYAFIAVADPGGGTATQLARRARAFGITAGLLYAGDPNGRVAQRFGVHTAGTVVVISPRGTITWTAVAPGVGALRRALAPPAT